MKVYAFRCIKDNPDMDDKISWLVGDWQGKYNSNGTQQFRFAEIYTCQETMKAAQANLDVFKQWGIEFEVVEFVLSVDFSGCLDDAMAEMGLEGDLAFDIRQKFEKGVRELVRELGGDI